MRGKQHKLPRAQASKWAQCMSPGQYTTCIKGIVKTSLLSERTPLERCCVHNMSPFVWSYGSRDAKVQRAKVGLNCTEPSVARSSCWSLAVEPYLSDTYCKGSMVVLARWTANNMAEEPQMSVSHQVRERWTTSGSSDFRIWHMARIQYPQDLA